MSLSYYNPNERYRRRAAGRVGNFFTAMFIIAVIFGFGFWVGHERAALDEAALKQKVEALELQNAEIEQTLVDSRSEAQTAVMRYEQLQETYQEQIPDGPITDLLALLRKQLEEGRDPDRLAFLIRSARPPRNCSEAKTKRFIVSTPANKGAVSKIAVADGAIVIHGKGVSARNDKGQPESWYDPSRPVKVEFVQLGGVKEVKSKQLPLHHSVIVGAREYRFTVSDGARSFAKVTFDSCDYP